MRRNLNANSIKSIAFLSPVMFSGYFSMDSCGKVGFLSLGLFGDIVMMMESVETAQPIRLRCSDGCCSPPRLRTTKSLFPQDNGPDFLLGLCMSRR